MLRGLRYLILCGLVILSSAAFVFAADIETILDSANGTSAFEVKDSGSVDVFRVDSDGGIDTPALLSCAALATDGSGNVTCDASIDVSGTGLIAGDNITLAGNTLNVDNVFIFNTGDTGTGNYFFANAHLQLPTDNSLPAICTAGEIYIDANATSGQRLYVCESANTWVQQGGGTGSDITTVGDVTSGAAFDGTQGTILTFNNAGGDGILSYDGTDFNIDKSFSLGTAGVRLSGDGDGAVTFLGLGDGSDEALTINLDDTSNHIVLSTSTSATDFDLTLMDLMVGGGDASLGTAGVKLTGDGDGAITFLGLGNGSDEDLTMNLDDTTNTAVLTSSTGLTAIDLSFTTVIAGLGSTLHLGSAGVTFSDDDDGALTITGRGDGNDENLKINLDDTANIIVLSSSTGVTSIDYGTIGADYDSSTVTLSTVSGVVDATNATSLTIPLGTAPTVNSQGEIAFDATDDQFLYGDAGGTARVLHYLRQACVMVENLADADDNMMMFQPTANITLSTMWCTCQGTCTTTAGISMEVVETETAGPTVNNLVSNVHCAALTAAPGQTSLGPSTMTALDVVRFDVSVAPVPDGSDEYLICFDYYLTPQ